MADALARRGEGREVALAPRTFRVGILASLAACAACATSPAMRAAGHGDLGALRDAIASRESAGTLSNGEAASIAMKVAGRDLLSGPVAEAPDRVLDALPCAHELDDVLADRMRMHDAAGADAALARIAGRGLTLDDARAFAADPDPRWRAVGARALVRPTDREARLRALADESPLVRRQAARAARDAADPADLNTLSEAARLDPQPIVRTEAVRAMAALPSTPGGAAADALRDLWTSGDDALREDIALGWASPSIWDAGGREALRVLVASGHGPGVIEGAAAILRKSEAERFTTRSTPRLASSFDPSRAALARRGCRRWHKPRSIEGICFARFKVRRPTTTSKCALPPWHASSTPRTTGRPPSMLSRGSGSPVLPWRLGLALRSRAPAIDVFRRGSRAIWPRPPQRIASALPRRWRVWASPPVRPSSSPTPTPGSE